MNPRLRFEDAPEMTGIAAEQRICTMIEHPGLFFGFLASVFAVVVDGLGKRFRRRRFAISLFGAVVFSAAGATMSFTYLDTGTPVGFEHTLFCLFVSLLGFLFSVDLVACCGHRYFKVKVPVVLLSLANVVLQPFRLVS